MQSDEENDTLAELIKRLRKASAMILAVRGGVRVNGEQTARQPRGNDLPQHTLEQHQGELPTSTKAPSNDGR